MLHGVRPTKPDRAKIESVDALLEPLLRAAVAGQPMEDALLRIARTFGFDSFVYGLATATRPDRDSRTYVWTSLPDEWVQEYEENAYIEIDPRVTAGLERASPFIWDSADMQTDRNGRHFLKRAARQGIRSGAVVAFSTPAGSRVGFGLNSRVSPVPAERRADITSALGNLMLLATRIHDLFMSHIVARGVPPLLQGKPLSRREKECLMLAARGLPSPDIAQKLGITARTANFHFGNILSKLAALNRSEAIVKAIAAGLIEVGI